MIHFKCVLKGSFFAAVSTFVFIMIISAVAFFSNISENMLMICVYAGMAASVIAGSAAAVKASGSKAFIHSVFVCVIYAALLLGISATVNGQIAYNMHFAAVICGIFASGFLGCLIGK